MDCSLLRKLLSQHNIENIGVGHSTYLNIIQKTADDNKDWFDRVAVRELLNIGLYGYICGSAMYPVYTTCWVVEDTPLDYIRLCKNEFPGYKRDSELWTSPFKLEKFDQVMNLKILW